MCSDPVFMINQELRRSFRGIKRYLIDGRFFSPWQFDFDYSNHKLSFDDFRKYWYHCVSHLTHQDAYDNYFVELDNGLIRPLFMLAPCGKCPECRMNYASELKSRLQLEYVANGCKPIVFLTLTYAEKCLPKFGVDQEELTRFIDRFRLYASDFGFNRGWRIFYCSEYGSDPNRTRRPHYHLLIYNVDFDFHESYKKFTLALRKAWPFGRREWEFSRSPYSLCGYVTKYVTKSVRLQDNVPEGKNPNFWRGPSKNGGLGSGMLDYISKNFDYIKDTDVLLRTPFGVTKVRVPKFILDKLCPPLSRHVSKRIFDMVKAAMKSYDLLCKIGPSLGYDVSCFENPIKYYLPLKRYLPWNEIIADRCNNAVLLARYKWRPGRVYIKEEFPTFTCSDGSVITSHNVDYGLYLKLCAIFRLNRIIFKHCCRKLDKFYSSNSFLDFDSYLDLVRKKDERFMTLSKLHNIPDHNSACMRYSDHIVPTPFSIDLPYDGEEYTRELNAS